MTSLGRDHKRVLPQSGGKSLDITSQTLLNADVATVPGALKHASTWISM